MMEEPVQRGPVSKNAHQKHALRSGQISTWKLEVGCSTSSGEACQERLIGKTLHEVSMPCQAGKSPQGS